MRNSTGSGCGWWPSPATRCTRCAATADQEGFGFPLLSDFWPHGAAARAYGVFDEARGCAGRGSFLIDRDGVLRWSLVNPISEARPLEAYREALANAEL